MRHPRSRMPFGRHRFDDRLTSHLPDVRDVWRIFREGGFKPKDAKRDAPLVPRAQAPVPSLADGEASVTWVGHATFLVRMAGAAFLTDPVWSKRLPGFVPRLTEPGVAWDALPPIDGVVVSHNHFDHLDAPTIKRLPRATPIFVGLGGGKWFRRRGFQDVIELDWWESAERAGVEVSFVPAHHWSRRGLFDRNQSLWGGFVMKGGGASAYFAGDTGYGHFFKEIGRRHKVDVAMLPIGAYEPSWFMRPVHMDPEEAVRAFEDLGAKRLATMHWGTFPLTREPVLQPLERIRSAWKGEPDALWDLALGETRTWKPPAAQPGTGRGKSRAKPTKAADQRPQATALKAPASRATKAGPLD